MYLFVSFVSRSALFLTTMHLCVLWVVSHHYAPLGCSHHYAPLRPLVFSSPLCTSVSFGFHYAPLCFLSPLCTFVFFFSVVSHHYAPLCFFVTFSVLFVMYVCCVCVCLVFVSSNSSHSTSVMLTCQLVFDS